METQETLAPASPDLAQLAKNALKKAEFDPRIVSSIKALSKIGINIAPETPPGYVLAVWFECMNGLRKSRKSYENHARTAETKARKLEKRLEADDLDDDEREVVQERMASEYKEARQADMMHAQLCSRIGETGKDILHLYSKMKDMAKPDGGGAMSWDPDAEKPQVNVQVNVNGPAQIAMEGK